MVRFNPFAAAPAGAVFPLSFTARVAIARFLF